MPDKKTTTYRDSIQQMQRLLWDLYDHVGYLRDCAEGPEKEFFNKFRGNIYGLTDPLSKLDNTLSEKRAKMPVYPLTLRDIEP